MDFREREDQLYFLEANVIPGLHPTEADLTNMCQHANIAHADMVALILDTAIKRLSAQYPARFEKKTELLNELTNKAISQATRAGEIVYQDRVYNLLG